jgi:hypothetical protein
MATTAKEEEERIYFRVYRTISFFTGFVEYLSRARITSTE